MLSKSKPKFVLRIGDMYIPFRKISALFPQETEVAGTLLDRSVPENNQQIVSAERNENAMRSFHRWMSVSTSDAVASPLEPEFDISEESASPPILNLDRSRR
jgi:hypothetical protein